MISDLDENENEEDSELAVEKLGLKGLNDLGPPELPHNDASFGEINQHNEPPQKMVALEANYSGAKDGQQMKPHQKKKMRV